VTPNNTALNDAQKKKKKIIHTKIPDRENLVADYEDKIEWVFQGLKVNIKFLKKKKIITPNSTVSWWIKTSITLY
jgi:hypothetical protein